MRRKIGAALAVTAGTMVIIALAGTPVAADTHDASAAACLSDTEETDVSLAGELRAEVDRILDDPEDWRRASGEAAGLLERSAMLGSACDPETYRSLRFAAVLYEQLGKDRPALRLMRASARRALETGQVEEAAHAYLNTALLAIRGNDMALAWEATRKAELLSSSPLLTGAERDRIRSRIRGSTTLAGEAVRNRVGG